MGAATKRAYNGDTRPSTAKSRPPMPKSVHHFAEGDRVRAARRPEFPDGTVLKLMDLGYLLIRWDSDVLETAHHSELLVKAPEQQP